MRLRPAAAVATDGPPPVTLRSMVEQDLSAMPRGREIYQLYFTHHMEIRELIDRNRRVATVWHRQGGPGLIQAVLDAVRSRTSEIPMSIRGRNWSDRVAAILAIFDTFGSARLRDDIGRFGRELEGLGGLTYPGFLDRLKVLVPDAMATQPGTLELLLGEIGPILARVEHRLAPDTLLLTCAELGLQFPDALLNDAPLVTALTSASSSAAAIPDCFSSSPTR